MIPLTGYSDRLSAAPGERIAFKVSSAARGPYRASLARVIHADPNPAGPGVKIQDLAARFAIERLFTVPAGAFRPAPKVESAVARLVPLGATRPAIADEALFARIVAAAFGQRRKTLRNALASLADEAALRGAGIDPGARGETLSVADFVRLANDVGTSR